MKTTRRVRWALAGMLLGAGAWTTPAPAGDVMLQYFEAKWETIERRMPDVFMARYNAIWVPPPHKADSGGFSVGYDVFDRFNLGTPYDRTLYGTEQGFHRMSREMGRAGVLLFADTIVNHNGFRDGSTPGFEDNGGYPGFVTRLSGDVDGDFHGAFEGGDWNMRLAGLIDIAQEKNHRFVRHPVPGFSNNIPNETPRESNRQFYPDLDLPAEFGRHPFNLANPMAGDPVEENATGLLLRHLQWMAEVHGVDGFRIDAVKHVPQWFFNNLYDGAVFNLGRNPIDGSRFTPFSFGEAYDGDFGLLGSYTRKDGFGNRDMLDFPLFFAMREVFDAQGFGDMRRLEFASFDGSDGNANDGSRGVLFVNSHDNTGGGFTIDGPGFNIVAHAHILTRTGYPLVYYNAHEFGYGRDFPKPGRWDALGNTSSLITRLVRVNKEYGRGAHSTRWVDGSIYIYERLNACLVGLSDRGDGGFDERNVVTAFAPGTVLVELTGNATSATVDPFNDIFDSVTVDGNGRVSIRVPRNRNANGSFHGRGYVVYGPAKPNSTLTIPNATGTIAPDPADGRLESLRRLTPLHVVTDDTIQIRLEVAAQPASDNALVKVNFGEVDVDGSGTRNAHGEFAGFESFQNVSNGVYTATIDATQLAEGYTYIETVAFLQRPSGTPHLYDNQRLVVYLDRQPPQVDLRFPTRTGSGDITSPSYEVVVSSDHTVDSLHILRDVPPGATDEDILALLNSGNRARRHDRLEWRRVLEGLGGSGTMEVTVVAFEESGNYSITRFGNIGLGIVFPQVLLGVDVDASPSAVTFDSFPATIDTDAYPNEIVVRVNTQTTPGGPVAFANGDYSVTLQVNDGPVLTAQGFDAALLPPIGRLVQNDQNLGDAFDEFRFVWRGYGPGVHRFRATARLTGAPDPPAEAIAFVDVTATIDLPRVVLTNPAPPGQDITNPTQIAIEGTFETEAAQAQIFLDGPGGTQLVGTLESPPLGAFSVTRPVGTYALVDTIPSNALMVTNDTYVVRVVASTGPNGTGFVSNTSSQLTVSGIQEPTPLAPFRIDGDASDLMALPVLAVSAADGGEADGTTPADFGADGTLTELRAGIRDNVLGIALRGDMFGRTNDNFDNVSIVFVDVAAGSGQGAKNLATDLTDESDGLRGDISRANFELSPQLVGAGIGFDAAFGMTQPGVAYGYSFGTDGLPGSFGTFEFQPGFTGRYDANVSGVPGAPGTVFAAPNAFEIALPLEALGNPDPRAIRLVAVTSAGNGFPSPNMLPENASNAFVQPQVIEAVAALPTNPKVLINEVFVGVPDWVELYNPQASPVDLSGWVLRMNDQDQVPRDYVFAAGATLGAGAYLVVSDEGGPTPPAPQSGVRFAAFNIPWHQTRGGSVALVDPFGIGIDYVDWRNAQDSDSSGVVRHVPAGTTFTGTVAGPASETAGRSLGRDGASTDTDTAEDWNPSSTPTPGAANSSAPPIVPGDANGDGVVTPADAQAAFECYINGACAPGISVEAADIHPDDGDGCVDAADGNGIVTPADAQRLFQHALQIIGACP
ncbi:MAG: lamin tail domain-containing protein [Candidatus Sumerlaeia bacterium]|nr:lamin tail domain-containing protein [Candidatus Sumerlaeia bacterium]